MVTKTKDKFGFARVFINKDFVPSGAPLRSRKLGKTELIRGRKR